MLGHFSVCSYWVWWSGKLWTWYYHSPNQWQNWQSSWRFAQGNCNSTNEAKASSQRYPTNVPSLDCWLWQYWLRLIIGTDSGDNCVHVDANAKTGEVHHGVHSTNASNCSLSLGLMRVGKVHDVLRCSFDLAWELSFDKNFIPLRKKSRWFHWVGLIFETGNLLCPWK